MHESCTLGSVRGAPSNGRPYRNPSGNGNRNLVGACAMVRNVRDEQLVYPDKLIRVRVDRRVSHAAFVEKAASTSIARDFIEAKLKTSAGQVGISGSDLRKLPVVLPPLREQERIADKLDALFARVEACRTRLDRVPVLLKRLRQAVLEAAFTGELTTEWRSRTVLTPIAQSIAQVVVPPRPNRFGSRSLAVIPGDYALAVGKPDRVLPLGWAWTALVDVAQMESGHTPSRSHPEYWGGDIRWLGIADARDHHAGLVTETYQRTNELGIANSAARVLPAGTVCLSRTASVGYVVRTGVPMATSQDFANWTCTEAVNTDWLKYLFVAEKQALFRFGKGSTHTTIYFPELMSFCVGLPPVEEQAEIVRRVDCLFALADSLESRYEAARAQVDRLTPALLAKAFRGELVPQDPNDEPADAMLARLRGEGANGKGADRAPNKRGRGARSARPSSRPSVTMPAD